MPGIAIFKKNNRIAALKPITPGNPICVIKNTDAPSLMPNSPNVNGGIIVLVNIVKIPANKYK